MSSLTWLHLSDWHQKGPKFNRQEIRDLLVADIENRGAVSESLKKIDFVIFSGDLAFAGKDDEYDCAASEFLNPILKAVGLSSSELMIVPGNHDLNRDHLDFLPPLLKALSSAEKVKQWLESATAQQALAVPMTAYSAFCKNYLAGSAPAEPVFSFVKGLDVDGKRIALAGLNSAWMCGQNKIAPDEVDDYGRLILGESEVYKTIAKSKEMNADVRIAVLHHPFSWMSQVEQRDDTERQIYRNFHFILRGHEHQTEMITSSGTSGNSTVISAGACYDSAKYPNSYNFVHLNLLQGRGTVYARRYEPEAHRFGTDSVRTSPETPGLHTFLLPKDLCPKQEPTGSTARQSERVEGDIWAIQDPATMTKLARVYASHHENRKFKYVSSKLIVRANCLAGEGQPGFGEADEIRLIKIFEPLDEALYCLKASIFFAPEGRFQGQITCETEGPLNSPLESLNTLKVPVKSSGKSDDRELLLFFIPALPPRSGRYKTDVKFNFTNSMGPLRREGKDTLYLSFSRAAGEVGQADLILYFPSEFKNLKMGPLLGEKMAGGGELITDGSLQEMDGYSAIGWRGRALPPDKAFGVIVEKI